MNLSELEYDCMIPEELARDSVTLAKTALSFANLNEGESMHESH